MYEPWNKPLAVKCLISYRYHGPFGWIMIGASNTKDALQEARRSLEVSHTFIKNLQIWDDMKKCYINIVDNA